MGFPGGTAGKSVCLQCRRPGFDPWVGKIPWRKKWQPTPVFLPGKFHGQSSLVVYNIVHGVAKSQTWMSNFTFTFNHQTIPRNESPLTASRDTILTLSSSTTQVWQKPYSSNLTTSKYVIDPAITEISSQSVSIFCYDLHTQRLPFQPEKTHDPLLGRRRQWHPTPGLLPGESQGQRSLVGCHPWGHTESDTTEVTWRQQHPHYAPGTWDLLIASHSFPVLSPSPCPELLTVPWTVQIGPCLCLWHKHILWLECSSSGN